MAQDPKIHLWHISQWCAVRFVSSQALTFDLSTNILCWHIGYTNSCKACHVFSSAPEEPALLVLFPLRASRGRWRPQTHSETRASLSRFITCYRLCIESFSGLTSVTAMTCAVISTRLGVKVASAACRCFHTEPVRSFCSLLLHRKRNVWPRSEPLHLAGPTRVQRTSDSSSQQVCVRPASQPQVPHGQVPPGSASFNQRSGHYRETGERVIHVVFF